MSGTEVEGSPGRLPPGWKINPELDKIFVTLFVFAKDPASMPK